MFILGIATASEAFARALLVSEENLQLVVVCDVGLLCEIAPAAAPAASSSALAESSPYLEVVIPLDDPASFADRFIDECVGGRSGE